MKVIGQSDITSPGKAARIREKSLCASALTACCSAFSRTSKKPYERARPWRNAEMKTTNSLSSMHRLSSSSKTPSRKRSFCFLEMVEDKAMHVQMNAGMLTFSDPAFVFSAKTFIHSATFAGAAEVNPCNWFTSKRIGARPGVHKQTVALCASGSG